MCAPFGPFWPLCKWLKQLSSETSHTFNQWRGWACCCCRLPRASAAQLHWAVWSRSSVQSLGAQLLRMQLLYFFWGHVTAVGDASLFCPIQPPSGNLHIPSVSLLWTIVFICYCSCEFFPFRFQFVEICFICLCTLVFSWFLFCFVVFLFSLTFLSLWFYVFLILLFSVSVLLLHFSMCSTSFWKFCAFSLICCPFSFKTFFVSLINLGFHALSCFPCAHVLPHVPRFWFDDPRKVRTDTCHVRSKLSTDIVISGHNPTNIVLLWATWCVFVSCFRVLSCSFFLLVSVCPFFSIHAQCAACTLNDLCCELTKVLDEWRVNVAKSRVHNTRRDNQDWKKLLSTRWLAGSSRIVLYRLMHLSGKCVRSPPQCVRALRVHGAFSHSCTMPRKRLESVRCLSSDFSWIVGTRSSCCPRSAGAAVALGPAPAACSVETDFGQTESGQN